jgi:hypothetical protein
VRVDSIRDTVELARALGRISSLHDSLSTSRAMLLSQDSALTSLSTAVAARDSMISGLDQVSARLRLELDQARRRSQTHEEASGQLLQRVSELERELYTVRYCIGAERDLEQAALLIRKGGIFGRRWEVLRNESWRRCPSGDSRHPMRLSLPSGTRSIELVSEHSIERIVFFSDSQPPQLSIPDPTFWQRSRVLIVIVRR